MEYQASLDRDTEKIKAQAKVRRQTLRLLR
jgi:hypothetical protein